MIFRLPLDYAIFFTLRRLRYRERLGQLDALPCYAAAAAYYEMTSAIYAITLLIVADGGAAITPILREKSYFMTHYILLFGEPRCHHYA